GPPGRTGRHGRRVRRRAPGPVPVTATPLPARLATRQRGPAPGSRAPSRPGRRAVLRVTMHA
ncbi:hypothetical protein RZS08_05340, partial [Arthrospira platensis SPKY1]|nr:hypothetical protein [Arthrospira platensis SPKY1]